MRRVVHSALYSDTEDETLGSIADVQVRKIIFNCPPFHIDQLKWFFNWKCSCNSTLNDFMLSSCAEKEYLHSRTWSPSRLSLLLLPPLSPLVQLLPNSMHVIFRPMSHCQSPFQTETGIMLKMGLIPQVVFCLRMIFPKTWICWEALRYQFCEGLMNTCRMIVDGSCSSNEK